MGDIFIPQLEGGKRSTKDIIIDVLSQEWPLTAKKIYFRIKKNYGKSITYQAVFIALQQLVEKKVLSLENREYRIDIAWIHKMQSLLSKLDMNYCSKRNKVIHDPTTDFSHGTLTFKTIFDYDDYLQQALNYFLNKMKEKAARENTRPERHLYIHYPHSWWPILHPKENFYVYGKDILSNHKLLCLCRGDTAIDNWCNRQKKKGGGVKIKHGVGCANSSEVHIFGDYIVTAYFSKDVMTAWDKIYKEAKSVDDLDIRKLMDKVLNANEKVVVNVIESADIARSLKDFTTGFFKKQ